MSDDGFLARWSRRKRAAVARERGPAPPQPQQKPAQPIAESAGSGATGESAIDVADLPPIESIGPGADIRAFLAPGVPASLTRAALRRAWSADPAIRDFVGLSENSWDFTVADGVPGFGSVSLEDAKRLLDRLAGDPAAETPYQETAAGADEQPSGPIPARLSAAEEPPDRGKDDRGDPAVTKSRAAPQAEPETGALPLPRRPPRHGRALPE